LRDFEVVACDTPGVTDALFNRSNVL